MGTRVEAKGQILLRNQGEQRANAHFDFIFRPVILMRHVQLEKNGRTNKQRDPKGRLIFNVKGVIKNGGRGPFFWTFFWG